MIATNVDNVKDAQNYIFNQLSIQDNADTNKSKNNLERSL